MCFCSQLSVELSLYTGQSLNIEEFRSPLATLDLGKLADISERRVERVYNVIFTGWPLRAV